MVRSLIAAALLGASCCRGEVSLRKELDNTPFKCKEKYEASEIDAWVQQHLANVPTGFEKPHLLLLLGGSGAGKGTFLNEWREHEKIDPELVQAQNVSLDQFAEHGLDEYLQYIPEYIKTIGDPDNVYKDAADTCYGGAAIPAARKANDQIIAKRMNLFYEETGKNLDRVKKKVLPPFVDAGYRITMVFIDNDVEIAIKRSAGRFQKTGRYAPEDYIRGTFGNCGTSYEALKAMENIVSEAVYCDNTGRHIKCWQDGERPADALVPYDILEKGNPKFRSPSKTEL